MHLKLSSPTAVLFDHDIEKVTLPTWIGEITILPWHQPISTVLQSWVISLVTTDTLSEDLIVHEGQVRISVSKWLVMVDGENIIITTSVGVTSPSESQEVLETMKAKLEEELEAIKVEWNKAELEAAIMNLEKVTADLRMTKFKRVG